MKEVELVYIGRRMSVKKRLIHCYIDLSTKEEEAYTKILCPISVGSVMRCTRTESGVSSPYVFLRKATDSKNVPITTKVYSVDTVSKWIEADWAAKKDFDLQKEMKRVPKSKYENLVLQINDLIEDLPASQRKLFKMKLLMDLV